MATCKDCIHYDTCLYIEISDNKEEDYYTEFGCEYFKNKADFVEVVRCKDCSFWDNASNWNPECRRLDGLSSPNADDFCAYGERKS